MKLLDLFEKRTPDNREAQLVRADQLGFDTSRTFYHGTDRNFRKFKIGKNGVDELGPGVYLCLDAQHAGMWANTDEGGQVYPCWIRKGPLWDWDAYTAKFPEGRWYWKPGERPSDNLKMLKPVAKAWVEMMNAKYNGKTDEKDFMKRFSRNFHPDEGANRLLSQAGFVGSIKKSSQVPSQVCVFRPEDVRGIFAKFKKPEGHLGETR